MSDWDEEPRYCKKCNYILLKEEKEVCDNKKLCEKVIIN